MMGAMYVIAVTGLKGGVGKTSTAVNLAALSAEGGHRTLLWDLDPQGAATFCLALKPKLKGGAGRLIGGGRGGLAGVAKRSSIDGFGQLGGDMSSGTADTLFGYLGDIAESCFISLAICFCGFRNLYHDKFSIQIIIRI